MKIVNVFQVGVSVGKAIEENGRLTLKYRAEDLGHTGYAVRSPEGTGL